MKQADFRKFRSLISLLAFVLLVFAPVGIALASGSGGGEEHKGWVATDTYRVINFAVLAGLLFFVLRKPVAEALNSRIKGIEEQLEDLESRKKDAEKVLAEYDKKIATLEKEAGDILEKSIKQGEAAKKRILEEAALSADKLEEQAKRNIAHEFKEAGEKLRKEIVGQALAKAEDIIKSSINSDDQDKLVDEYLKRVVA